MDEGYESLLCGGCQRFVLSFTTTDLIFFLRNAGILRLRRVRGGSFFNAQFRIYIETSVNKIFWNNKRGIPESRFRDLLNQDLESSAGISVHEDKSWQRSVQTVKDAIAKKKHT